MISNIIGIMRISVIAASCIRTPASSVKWVHRRIKLTPVDALTSLTICMLIISKIPVMIFVAFWISTTTTMAKNSSPREVCGTYNLFTFLLSTDFQFLNVKRYLISLKFKDSLLNIPVGQRIVNEKSYLFLKLACTLQLKEFIFTILTECFVPMNSIFFFLF